MAPRLAWVLNFDAEMEMADPVGYRPSTRMLAHCERLEIHLLPLMERALDAQIEVVNRSGARRRGADLAGAQGLAWAPTPSALDWMHRQGITPMVSPGFEAIRQVNHRVFLSTFQTTLDSDRETLPGETFVTDLGDLEAHLAHSETGQEWLLKRPFGFAGRSQRLVRAGALQGADRVWAEASMDAYGRGLQVEPKVAVQAEFGLHAWMGLEGQVLMGTLQLQVLDARGSFVEARSCGEERSCEWIASAMEAALQALGQRAAGAGYFGPLGLDAFLWKDARGVSRLRVASDLNARFSMAWFQGMEKQLCHGHPWG